MTEVTAAEAGQIVCVDRETVRRWVHRQLIPAKRIGMRQTFRIDLDELRKFADEYNYEFNEELATKFANS